MEGYGIMKEVDITKYCAHAQKGMIAFKYRRVSKSGHTFGDYIYCADELSFYKLLNQWNIMYLNQYVFTEE